MIELGVNIDHVATVRQARQTTEPDPVWAAAAAELGGADGITVHLREDRRHIQDRDVRILREAVQAKLNLEMACEPEIVRIACEIVPEQATLVPEKRQEITTEGGLDVLGNLAKIKKVVEKLKSKGIFVSLFLDPDLKQIEAGKETDADAVELHTGTYSLATTSVNRDAELVKLTNAGKLVTQLGFRLHGGHGLTYHNVIPVAHIPNMFELNIGHSIIARALMVGLKDAVAEMKRIIN
ncbi:MAG: pyridoxine 5'-phosphate synthase [Planctomycetaceae bacterium]|jgi:pyridoxine 5-phosphate synthase|nr:pyridoxine 5'-phosphate synthase [Planctomycetaceae bacterium]